jgi:hypothetical protein
MAAALVPCTPSPPTPSPHPEGTRLGEGLSSEGLAEGTAVGWWVLGSSGREREVGGEKAWRSGLQER